MLSVNKSTMLYVTNPCQQNYTDQNGDILCFDAIWDLFRNLLHIHIVLLHEIEKVMQCTFIHQMLCYCDKNEGGSLM